MESDFLLDVYDENRTGGLRFKEERNGQFLNHDRRLAAPPWTTLRVLQNASLRIEQNDDIDNPEYIKWLNMLIAPGSSLGGARPKASIIDEAGNLWIAKFPSVNDTTDVGAWEMAVYNLAGECGLNVVDAKLEKFSNKVHTFLIKRFDRRKSKRIHFASAMTMLGYNEGTDFHAGASYLELADFLIVNGAKVNKDLEELWKRIVFSICVTNTDDHLRNHGFILTERGWVLSPVYDINPNESGIGLTLNISENDNSLDFDLALDVTGYFRLDKPRGKRIIDEIRKKASKWKTFANKYKISKSEQQIMGKAFKV